MPDHALRPCAQHGCPGLTRQRYCPLHEANEQQEEKQYARERGGTAKRGYDSVWQLLRLTYLQQHPLCEQCQADGLIVPAVLVHHIVPIKDGGARLATSNLRALCQPHHEAIHGKDRWKRRTYTR
jgi:5-methylcytosine-specific restriction protein A